MGPKFTFLHKEYKRQIKSVLKDKYVNANAQ